MPVTIENLHVTVHVQVPTRARLGEETQRLAESTSREPVYRLPPPPPDATGEAVVEVQGELDSDLTGWSAEALDVDVLAERVYEYMRYDIRVSRERRGDRL